MAENPGERLFREYVAQEGYPEPRRILTGKEETPDFELSTREGPVICEVKHFPWTPENEREAQRVFSFYQGHPGWSCLRDGAIRKAKRQLERLRCHLAVAVIVNTNPSVSLSDEAVIEAMLGEEHLLVMRNVAMGRVRVQATYLSRHGRIIHPERAAPWVSAVAVLE